MYGFSDIIVSMQGKITFKSCSTSGRSKGSDGKKCKPTNSLNFGNYVFWTYSASSLYLISETVKGHTYLTIIDRN